MARPNAKWKPQDPLRPEIVIGLVGAVGTDLEKASRLLQRSLKHQVRYRSHELRLSSFLTKYDVWVGGPPVPKGGPEDDRIDRSMTAGTQLRERCGLGEIVSRLAITQIRELRRGPEALRDTAFILRSLKHPEEARFLQRLYGPGFLLVGAYSSRRERARFLRDRIVKTRKGDKRLTSVELDRSIEHLISRDSFEESSPLGQQVSKTYHLADFFVDLDREDSQVQIDRFVRLLFGYPHHTPTREEHAMFIAHAAATRSGSLARQVGAAITDSDGDIVAVGSNEVAQVGGGQVWEERPLTDRDLFRDRDFDRGVDTASQTLEGLLADACGAAWDKLKEDVASLGFRDARKLLQQLAGKKSYPDALSAELKKTRLGDLIEFYREVHAEGAALMSAARRGVSIRGGTLYSTTFPCHECAKHIVAAGVNRVLYVEPYPKSKAPEFYPKAFGEDEGRRGKGRRKEKGMAESFVGVGPRRYRDLFSLIGSEGRKVSRKEKSGLATKWNGKKAGLRWNTWAVSYLDAEPWYISKVQERLDNLGLKGG